MNRIKNLWLLVAVQTACLAVGLWVHYLYVSATTYHEAETQTRDQLVEASRPIFTAILQANAGEEQIQAYRRLVQESPLPEPASIGLYDAHWTPLATSAAIEAMQWRQPLEGAGKAVVGQTRLGGAMHVAVVETLPGGNRLVAFHPHNHMQIGLASMRWPLVVAGLITFVWTCGLFSIAVYMMVTHNADKLNKSRIGPEVEALKRAQALVRTQETIIFGLAKLSDSRDGDTGDHLERISFYCSSLASAMRQHPAFREVVSPAFVQLIATSSALHDIGKVGVEDAILRKPGLLTRDEHDRMKKHTIIGEECLKEIERRLGTSNFLRMAREIASFHHERWDGKGYPYGLRGEQIPLAARITAIADVYDALASKRVYKDAYSHEECVAIIRDEGGKHFDPRMVEVFLQIEPTFRDIARRFRGNAVVESASGEETRQAEAERAAEMLVAAE